MRVLLVEDEPRLADTVRRGLEAHQMVVDVEHDGVLGLWRATEGSHDVIVLDIMLPSLNGYRVCGELRAAGVRTPVLMLTAKDGEHDEADALDTGADDFLRKPFSFVVLVARLRALVRRGGPDHLEGLRCGPLLLSPADGTVVRDGITISLSPRESDVLEVLVRAGGQPVRAQRILDHVWGMDANPASNVVQVTIRYLRRKLDEPFESPSIETVRGFGYRITTDTEA